MENREGSEDQAVPVGTWKCISRSPTFVEGPERAYRARAFICLPTFPSPSHRLGTPGLGARPGNTRSYIRCSTIELGKTSNGTRLVLNSDVHFFGVTSC
jgi:hypothetical protein